MEANRAGPNLDNDLSSDQLDLPLILSDGRVLRGRGRLRDGYRRRRSRRRRHCHRRRRRGRRIGIRWRTDDDDRLDQRRRIKVLSIYQRHLSDGL